MPGVVRVRVLSALSFFPVTESRRSSPTRIEAGRIGPLRSPTSRRLRSVVGGGDARLPDPVVVWNGDPLVPRVPLAALVSATWTIMD